MSGTIGPRVERNRRWNGALVVGYLQAGFEVALARLKRGRTSCYWGNIEDELQLMLCARVARLAPLPFLPFLMARATILIHVTAVAAYGTVYVSWPLV